MAHHFLCGRLAAKCLASNGNYTNGEKIHIQHILNSRKAQDDNGEIHGRI